MTTTTTEPAVGVFDSLDQAERSIAELRHAGFQTEEIGIMGHVENQRVPAPPQTRAPEENAITGLVMGAVWGAVIGFLVILIIPGLGVLSDLGRWFEILGGAILGAVVGGVVFAFGTLTLAGAR